MSNEICRVCETSEDLHHIFVYEDPDIVRKLMICADIEVDYGDELPKYICSSCIKNLNVAYEFKMQCERTDKKLRDLICKEFEIFDGAEESYILVADPKEDTEEYLVEEFEGVEEFVENDDTSQSEECDKEYMNIYEEQTNTSSEKVEFKTQNFTKSEGGPFQVVNESDERYDDCSAFEYQEGNIQQAEDRDLVRSVEIVHSLTGTESVSDEEIEKIQKSAGLSEKFFSCDTCGDSFSSFANFNQHKKSHGDQRYQCPVCMKWFSKRYRLKNHMEIHEQSKSYCCEICGKKYTNQGNLDRHIRHFHKKERPYMCTECGLSFSRSNILKLHYTVHTNERNYECEICNKRFKAQYYLNLHKKSHIPIEERRSKLRKRRNTNAQQKIAISCSYCGKKSASKSLHMSHIRIHTGEKPFECKTCSRKFAFRQSLKSHELLHTGEKPYRCELCNLNFRQIGHLKGHMLVHSGVKKHKCQYCDKAFSLKSNLVVHQRLHTGETPYQCNLCHKKFYDSNGLKRHSHSHSKAKDLQEIREIQSFVALEPINSYFEGEEKEYGEIIEMQADEEIKLVDLNECPQEVC